MDTNGTWKLTIIGGDENGSDFTLPSDKPVVIGRSHSADLRLVEPDISGRHVELFVTEDGEAQMRNLSRFSTWIGSREIASGAAAPIGVRDAIELGRHVRVRMNAVPGAAEPPASPASPAPNPDAAQDPDAALDAPTLTSPGGGETFCATQAPETNATCAPAPSLATQMPETLMTSFAAEPATAAAPPPSAKHDSATRKKVPAPPPPADTVADDCETIFTAADGGAADEGETRMLETRLGSFEEILQLHHELERRSRFRKVAVGFAFAVFAAVLAALWFVSRTTRETETMDYPRDAQGRRDEIRYHLHDGGGQFLIHVDYPRSDKMSVTTAPDSNGVSVVTFMGRDRDVPFFLQLETVEREEELKIDLMASVRAWIARTEATDAGFVFDERVKDELRPAFFEDVYPESCQFQSLYGVRFVMCEYKRTWTDGRLWHGILIYFRSGDTVYVFRREIPELHWERGGYRLRQDTNLAVYTAFIESYWESPGVEDLPMGRSTADLMDSTRTILSKERASDWPFLKKELDAALVMSWRSDPKTRDLAQECLRRFREVLRVYYYGKYNAFVNAKSIHDEKRMARIRQDCQAVFANPDERYFFLVANPEEWR